MEPAPGGPGAARCRLLAHQLDAATACPALRNLEVASRPHHRPPRPCARAPAAQAVPQGHRADSGRHPGTHSGPHNREQSKNYRYSTNHQVVIDADTQLVFAVGRPVAGNRNDCKAWELSGAKDAVGRTTVIADGGYRGTGLVIPHRREPGQTELPAWKEQHNTSHHKVRARGVGPNGPSPSGGWSGCPDVDAARVRSRDCATRSASWAISRSRPVRCTKGAACRMSSRVAPSCQARVSTAAGAVCSRPPTKPARTWRMPERQPGSSGTRTHTASSAHSATDSYPSSSSPTATSTAAAAPADPASNAGNETASRNWPPAAPRRPEAPIPQPLARDTARTWHLVEGIDELPAGQTPHDGRYGEVSQPLPREARFAEPAIAISVVVLLQAGRPRTPINVAVLLEHHNRAPAPTPCRGGPSTRMP
ncbi:hypothetical protein QF037_009768 [Streptomyces canus]|nr:hypothetical protein [Streptomyces canus]